MKFAWIPEPPFNFRIETGVTGCDYELARRMCEILGEPFEPVETGFSNLLPGLGDGRWDVTTGMFVTPERAARAFFTMPIWALRDGLLIAERNLGAIDGYRSLARSGRKLAVLHGQVQEKTALGVGIPETAIIAFDHYHQAAEAVADGRVDAYASVERAHRQHVARHPGLACVAVPASEKPAEPGAFACAHETTRDRLNQALRRFLGSDEHVAMVRSFGLSQDEIIAPNRQK